MRYLFSAIYSITYLAQISLSMVAAMSFSRFMLHLTLWILGNWLIKNGLNIEYNAGGPWQAHLGVSIQYVGAAMVGFTGWRTDLDYVSGV